MARRIAVSALVLAALAAAPPPPAHAVACAAPPGSEVAHSWPVSFDAVALSGPRFRWLLFTPARLHVLRYLTGSGPRVVRLYNGVDRVSIWDDFIASAGGVYRVYPFVRRGRTRIRRGEVVRTSLCYGTGAIRKPRSMRAVRGSLRTARSPKSRWHARLVRGPFGLRCVGTRRIDRTSTAHRECERMARPASAVFGMHATGSGEGASTLVMAQAPRLRTVTVASPGATRTVRAAPGLRIALAAYDGTLTPEDVRLTLRFAGGTTRRVSLKDR